MKGLYKIFNYTEQNIIEIEYLSELVQILGILKEVDEALFQFSPDVAQHKTEKFNEHEPWAVHHKKIIINEIILKLLQEIIPMDYDLEVEQSNQINDEKYTDFMLSTDLRELTKEEIKAKFLEYYTNENIQSKCKISYDNIADVLYITIKDAKGTAEFDDDFIAVRKNNNEIISIVIDGFKKRKLDKSWSDDFITRYIPDFDFAFLDYIEEIQ